MEEHLQTLRRVSPDVIAAAVVGVDGEIVASDAKAGVEDVLGPATTTLGTIAERAIQELGRGRLESAILEGSHGRVLVRLLDSGDTLVVVAEPTGRLGLLMDDVRAASEGLGREVAHA